MSKNAKCIQNKRRVLKRVKLSLTKKQLLVLRKAIIFSSWDIRFNILKQDNFPEIGNRMLPEETVFLR
jgi:hypothetical protein